MTSEERGVARLDSDKTLEPKMTSQDAFDDPAGTWNRRYAQPGYLFGTQPNAWLQAHASVWQPGQRVLCVADGEGRNSVWLAQQGLLVDAFDVAAVGIAKARQLAAEQRVQVNFAEAGCDDYAWPQGSLDGVAAIFIQFADPPLRNRIFERIVAALRPGGTLVLQGYTPRQLDYRTGGPPFLSHLYTEALLKDAFSELTILALVDYEADVHEGKGHHGRSALIGLVARKP